MRKIITVAGGAVKKPGNYKVRLGMSYRDMVEATGGFTSEPYKIISGGPMMGTAMFTLDVPVMKLSSALLAFTEKEGRMPPERNCIRCAKCVDHCPAGLMPMELNHFVLNGNRERFKATHGMACIECGCCSYVCPAKRHLAQSIRLMRQDLLGLPGKKRG
jgi:electron transport complex protein RnfC